MAALLVMAVTATAPGSRESFLLGPFSLLGLFLPLDFVPLGSGQPVARLVGRPEFYHSYIQVFM